MGVLLLLLSRFSRVRLCATPETAAHQAPPSLGFSRQEHWSGLPFLLQCRKVKSESEVAQSCPMLNDLMDCSLPSSSVHGIFQARVLEWGAIAFSENGGTICNTVVLSIKYLLRVHDVDAKHPLSFSLSHTHIRLGPCPEGNYWVGQKFYSSSSIRCNRKKPEWTFWPTRYNLDARGLHTCKKVKHK